MVQFRLDTRCAAEVRGKYQKLICHDFKLFDSLCEVVKQGHEQGACQFSWWCDGRPDDAWEEEPYSHAKEIARKALNRQLKDSTDGALYFHNRKIAPYWSSEYIRAVKVGEHVFYKPAGGKAK